MIFQRSAAADAFFVGRNERRGTCDFARQEFTQLDQIELSDAAVGYQQRSGTGRHVVVVTGQRSSSGTESGE